MCVGWLTCHAPSITYNNVRYVSINIQSEISDSLIIMNWRESFDRAKVWYSLLFENFAPLFGMIIIAA